MSKKLKKLTRYINAWVYEFDDGDKVCWYDNGDVKIVLADGSTKYYSAEEVLDMTKEDNEMSSETRNSEAKVHEKQYWLGLISNLKLDGEYYVVNTSGDVVATVKGKILTIVKED